MAMFKKQPKGIGDVLNDYLDNYPHKRKLRQGMARKNWREVVGDIIADKTMSLKFEGDRLFVKMESSVWRHEVHAQRYRIKTKLNKMVGDEIVSDIIVRE